MIKNVGIGLRHCHFGDVIDGKPDVPWFEVHTENFFNLHSIAAQKLRKVRENYSLSAHGVGLSLGSSDQISEKHLQNIKNFISEFSPDLVSEHVSWSHVNGEYMNDLLPLPYTEEALKNICNNIERTQDFLKRKILVENPSSYMEFKSSEIPEAEFMAEIAKRSGCGILLDCNNIFVSSNNHGFDAIKYLDAISVGSVGEIHLAGYSETNIDGNKYLIDTHSDRVFPEVWKIYETAVKRFGDVPTLIEWDVDIPAFSVLFGEKEKAERIRQRIL